jgi:hypothetical protein
MGEKRASTAEDRQPKCEFRDTFSIRCASIHQPDTARQKGLGLVTGERQSHHADNSKMRQFV